MRTTVVWTMGLCGAMACGGRPPDLDGLTTGVASLSTSGADGDGDGGGAMSEGDAAADDSGGDGDDDGDDGDGGTEACNGFDDDGDGDVDETCACSPGQVQDCFAGPPGSILECRATTQQCVAGGGSETGSTWGACDGLCDGSTLTLDDAAMFVVWGAEAGDQLTLASPAGLADFDGDGEIDLIAASIAGDGSTDDSGAAYALFGTPCMQGQQIDLATLPLSGAADGDGFGGFVIDAHTLGYGNAWASFADVDGDGLGDVTVTDTTTSLALVRGEQMPAAAYEIDAPDGVQTFRLTNGGGSSGTYYGHAAADLDGDGHDDLFMPASNNTPGSCPCAPNGFSVWWGAAGLATTQNRHALVEIGIGTVGMASQSNFSLMGGFGDFNNDGYLDVTGGNGAANDTFLIPYKAMAFFGGPDRLLPSSMTQVDGTNGVMLVGGDGRGPQPNHQHGDFNGDGIDDVFTFGYVPYQVGAQLHVLFGHGGVFEVQQEVADFDGAGVVIDTPDGSLATTNAMGVGDIDADGFDDLVVANNDVDRGGVTIVWGRDPLAMNIDASTDPEVTVLEGRDGLGLVTHIAVADVDGDGLGDLVLGAANADGPTGQDSGAGLVKFGSCLAPHHNPALWRGYDGTETFAGAAERETIAAGRGDDDIDGGGGADVVYAGHGDDRVTVGDLAFARVDGGAGHDTLVLTAPAATLDLRAMGRLRVHGFERFELAGADQVLAANPGDLSAMTDGRAFFEIAGAVSSTVILDGEWTDVGDSDGDGLPELAHGALRVELDGPTLAP